MKCLWSYLVRWRSAAVIACCVKEGPKGEVILLGWRSNLERSKLISCGNRLLRHNIQLGINLSQDILAGVTWCGLPRFCGPKYIIISPNNGWFSEKPIGSLNYRSERLRISKNYWIWCHVGDDLAFVEFLHRNFPTFSARGDKLKYFGKLIINLIEFYTFKEICYLLVFLDFWKCRFCLLFPFENLRALNYLIL